MKTNDTLYHLTLCILNYIQTRCSRLLIAVLIGLLTYTSVFSSTNPKPINKTQYNAIQKQGTIGLVAGKHLDTPTDNYFTIPINNDLTDTQQIWLVYQVKGIAPQGISKRINNAFSTGGILIKQQEHWQSYREQLHPNWLKKGENVITFTLPEGANYGYQIKDVSIEVNKAQREHVVLNTIERSDIGQIYTRGLTSTDVDQLWIADQLINVCDNQFEAFIANTNTNKLNVKAILVDEKQIIKKSPINHQITAWDVINPITNRTSLEYKAINPNKAIEISRSNARLNIEENTFKTPLKLALSGLQSKDMIALEAGMHNVTKNHEGYKVFGINQPLKEDVLIKIPYDRTKIPSGYTEKDIRSYYFDYASGHWIAMKLDSINTEEQVIISKTNTPQNDMINGVIKTPESPESQGYTPTMFSDMKAADPTAKLQIIQPPSVNQRGSAGVGYSIELPPGRKGMQPSINIQYNSDSGNGWLGIGWNVSQSMISVETRWGVPRYKPDIESETYNIDGAMLAGTHAGQSFVAHKGNAVPREAERQFYKRLGGSFEKIIRHGTDPTNYHWEVTDKRGTIYYYGGIDTLDTNAVLRDPNTGHIAAWYLTEIRELHGNFMRYKHEVVNRDINGLPAVNVYCTEISYTGFNDNEGPYHVRFIRDHDLGETPRIDQRSNANYGFLTVEADLLRAIEVSYNGEMIRSYGLDYTTGAFYKSLLTKITHYDASGNVFNHHDLEYYDDVQSQSGYSPFTSSSESWSAKDDGIEGNINNATGIFSNAIPALGGSTTQSRGSSIYVGIGTGGGRDKVLTGGASYNRSRSTTQGLITMVDINGDGLADKVMDKGSTVTYRPNLSKDPEAATEFGEELTILGITSFSRVTSNSTSKGGKVYFGGSVGGETSKTRSNTSTYFSDVNGDGLIDLVNNGRVFFNHIEEDESGNPIPTFTSSSSDTPSPIISGGDIDITDTAVDPIEQAELIAESPLQDVVRVWKAAFNGTVDIEAPVSMLAPKAGYDISAYELSDGVRVAIQVRDNELWNTRIAKDDFAEKTPTGITGINVNRGDLIYFRVQAGIADNANGNFDLVTWDPRIQYTGFDDGDSVNQDIYNYQATDGNVITLKDGFTYIPDNQKASITGQFVKPVTSDDVMVRITNMQTDTLVFEKTYAWDAVVDEPITIPDVNLVAGAPAETELSFKLITTSNVDWKAVSWQPTVLVDDTGTIPVIVERSILADHRSKGQTYTPSHPNTTAIKIRPNLSFKTPTATFASDVVMTVKKADSLIGKLQFTVAAVADTLGIISLNVPIDTLIVPVEQSKVYTITYSMKDKSLADLLKDIERHPLTGEIDHTNRPKIILRELQTEIPTDTLGVNKTIYSHVFTSETDIRFGPLHRRWGQFVYNAMGGRSTQPIRETLLRLPNSASYRPDPVSEILVLMVPDNSVTKWQGYEAQTYVDDALMRTGRLGENDVILTNPLSELEVTGSGASAPVKVSKSGSSGAMGSIGFGVINGSVSNAGGSSELLAGFMDMNGDRYPDIITKNKVQYTNTLGGFDGEKTAINGNHRSTNSAVSRGVGASFVSSKSPTAGPFIQNESGSIVVGLAKNNSSISPSVGDSSHTDETAYSWIDVNGDGLPDKILGNKQVRINLGYTFSPAVDWNLDAISKGKGSSQNLGLGFDIGFTSFSGGIGLNRGDNETAYQLMDINSDGLIDKVRVDGSRVYVSLNQGLSFADEQIWSGINKISTSSSTGESANFAFTFCIKFPLIPIRLAINPGGNTGASTNRNLTELRDIDADGYMDFINSDTDNLLTVKRSTIARTNRLKTVINPLGGSFDIDYAHNEATYNHPGGKWVMSSLTIKDGLYDDGENMKTVFEYAQGKYDRHERAFLGFGEVTARSIDTEVADDTIYRNATQAFDVSNYYKQGNLLEEQLTDASGNLYTKNANTYTLFQLNPSGDSYPRTLVGEVTPERGIAYTPLRFTETQAYEGGPSPATLTQSNYEYGSYGEILNFSYTDKGNLSASEFNYKTQISYTNNLSHYLLSLPIEVSVTDSENTLYRKTNADYNTNTGDILQIRQTLNTGGETAITDLIYDTYGNIIKRTLPKNHKGERMFYEYRYEGTVNTYVSRIEDAFGYLTRYDKYDFRYGQLLQSESINGYFTNYEIDDLGRLTKIQGPNEEEQGIDYTLKFEYAPIAELDSQGISKLAHAVTQHYDPEHPDDPLETVTFVDGLGRPVQVKKDATITTVDAGTPVDAELMIASGRVTYDAFGRTKASYYPTAASLDERTVFSRAFDTINPTTTTFDVLDRPLSTTLPDDATTSMMYDVDTDTNTLITRLTDALGNSKASYTNGSQLTTKVEEFSGPNGTITTLYDYDAINQLLTVTDTEGNTIQSIYDLAGRRTAIDHPDAGVTQFVYDPMSNMIARQTANLAASGKQIDYIYEFGRLTHINYPEHPINNVTYYYGDRNASENRVGRLLLQEDATGGQEFFYDRLGNLEKQIRTIVIPNNAIATFVTKWRYDSWNRLQEMIYPDEEKVSYSYNKGGLLDGITGEKTFTYNYLGKLGYDKFEQRRYLKYCNGSETIYTYEPERRRLSQLNVWTGAGFEGNHTPRQIIDNAYTYDAVSNVLGVTNNAPLPTGEQTGGQMQHSYSYDGLYRLTTASGTYTGAGNKTASYTLNMDYDNLHNITRKMQHIKQTDVQFQGLLQAGYDLSYTYGDTPHQIDTLGEAHYRTDALPKDATEAANTQLISEATKTHTRGYDYDANGNLLYNHTTAVDSLEQERKLRWDEENRLYALSDNGFISSYSYDAGGERVVKHSGHSEAMYVNSLFSGGRTQTDNYTVYVNPFIVIRNGGGYTKHFYIGDQRIVSKLGDLASFGEDPRRIEYAGDATEGVSIDYAAKYAQSQAVITNHYETFKVPYNGRNNDDYLGGTGFCCNNEAGKTNNNKGPWGDGDTPETLQYFYHPDHLGSASFITNLDGEVSQHIEYVPFGEVFIEERNNIWNTPYLFNGKELDEETGLYYYGARYYDPKTSLWLSVDSMWEHTMQPYQFSYNNPVKFVDPDGNCPDCDDNGITGNGVYVEKTHNGQRFYGTNIKLRAEGKYGGTNIRSSSYSFGYEAYKEEGGAHINASTHMLEIGGDVRVGLEDYNIAVEGVTHVKNIEGMADAGLYTGENGKYGAELGAGVGAYMVKGEIVPSITVFGVRIGVKVGGSAGSAHIGAKGSATFNQKTREGELTAEANIGLGAGVKLGFSISNITDINTSSNIKDTVKRVRNRKR